MTDLSRFFAMAVLLPALAMLLWSLIHTAAQCHAAGGTVVRGLVWLECIQ